jgi:hypothetical protein
MIEDTVRQIESRIQGAEAIGPERKAELLSLVQTLRSEVAAIAQTHSDQAQTIADFTEISAREATSTRNDHELRQLSLDGMTASVRGFEKSHPRLVETVNAISNTLSGLGI